MAYGKDAAPLTSQTSFSKRAYLDQRVARWGGSRADAVSVIVDMWFALGAPPLNVAESYMPHLPIPVGARVELPTYWSNLVAFEAEEDDPKEAVKQEALRLLKRPRKGHKASGGEHHQSTRA